MDGILYYMLYYDKLQWMVYCTICYTMINYNEWYSGERKYIQFKRAYSLDHKDQPQCGNIHTGWGVGTRQNTNQLHTQWNCKVTVHITARTQHILTPLWSPLHSPWGNYWLHRARWHCWGRWEDSGGAGRTVCCWTHSTPAAWEERWVLDMSIALSIGSSYTIIIEIVNYHSVLCKLFWYNMQTILV